MKKILAFPFLILCQILFLSALPGSCPNCPVDYVTESGNTYTFNLNSGGAGSQCDWRGWNRTSAPSEQYTFCWVTSDGGYQMMNSSGSSDATPQTSITSNSKIAFTTACNKYGDDNDKMIVAGGYTGGGAKPSLSYSSFPVAQNNLSFPSLLQINTSHGTNLAQQCNQLMLIITINSEPGNGDTIIPPTGDLKLFLYHNSTTVNYTAIDGESVNSPYPDASNEYFEFADHSGAGAPPALSGFIPLHSWKVTNNFFGKEKNIYCLLEVQPFAGEDQYPRNDQFKVLLTNNNGTPLQQSIKTITVGSSYDPNLISVSKDTSQVCGSSAEELEYTIHFQNTGLREARTVFVNLEADPALDLSTLAVTNASIGTTFSQTFVGRSADNNNFTTPSSAPNFMYCINTASSPASPNLVRGNVSADASFKFENIGLQGTDFNDVNESVGSITFKIKTRTPYSSIHNRAGIFFDSNAEIITNLAITNCANPDSTVKENDDCAAQLNKCNQQLQECQHTGLGWMQWLGWIIAGMEFLFLIFLLIQKKK